jgi:hypothetical protein
MLMGIRLCWMGERCLRVRSCESCVDVLRISEGEPLDCIIVCRWIRLLWGKITLTL